MTKAKLEPQQLGACSWETAAFLLDIRAAAERIVSDTTEMLGQLSRPNVLFDSDESTFFSPQNASKYLAGAEGEVYKICQALSLLDSDAAYENKSWPAHYAAEKKKHNDTVQLIQQQDLIILKTPYLKKSLNPKCKSDLPFSPLSGCIYTIDKSLFPCGPVDLYILSAYDPDIPSNMIIDADNINVKAFGDPITQFLEIDDNGLDVSLHIYAIKTRRLEPSSYTIVVPQTKEKMGPDALENVVKMAFETYVK